MTRKTYSEKNKITHFDRMRGAGFRVYEGRLAETGFDWMQYKERKTAGQEIDFGKQKDGIQFEARAFRFTRINF